MKAARRLALASLLKLFNKFNFVVDYELGFGNINPFCSL